MKFRCARQMGWDEKCLFAKSMDSPSLELYLSRLGPPARLIDPCSVANTTQLGSLCSEKGSHSRLVALWLVGRVWSGTAQSPNQAKPSQAASPLEKGWFEGLRGSAATRDGWMDGWMDRLLARLGPNRGIVAAVAPF